MDTKSNVERILELIQGKIAEIKKELESAILGPWDSLEGIKKNTKIFYNVVFKVISIVEDAVNQIDGKVTENEVFDAITQAINKIIDIPWVPEWIEGKVIRKAIEYCDDLLDEKLGNEWYKEIGRAIEKADTLGDSIENLVTDFKKVS